MAKFQEYKTMLATIQHKPKIQQLNAVFYFFISRLIVMPDMVVQGVVDYWQTLDETLKLGSGDCEDFAIAWYFTLLQFGFNTWIEYWNVPALGAHMVCVAKCGGEVYVLDSMSTLPYLRSKNPVKTIYRLTKDNLFIKDRVYSSNKVQRWESVLERMNGGLYENN